MTRRDKCHFVGRRAEMLSKSEAAAAWCALSYSLIALGESDMPKYRDLIRSIRAATIIGKQTNQKEESMRTLTDHKVNGLNEAITIKVLDEPGAGGACHEYAIELNPDQAQTPIPLKRWPINFQNGPVKEAGFNGISQEALLTIVIDRLRSFQAGQYACRENAIALTSCEEALMWLQKRTRDRMARGVEGTNEK